MSKKGMVLSLLLSILFFIVSLSPQIVTAQVNKILSESELIEPTFVVPPQPGTILLLDDGVSQDGKKALDKFGYTYTHVSPAGFSSVDLYNFDIIFVAWLPSQSEVDALNARKNDIAKWISDGGGIVVNAEWKGDLGVSNPYSFLPVTFDTESGFYHTDGVHIIDSTHPLVTGLTDALLVWGNSVHGKITVIPSSGATVVTKATAYDSPHIIGMCYGKGKIVVAASDPEFHVVNGPGDGPWQLLYNELKWASEPCGGGECDLTPVLEALDAVEVKLDALGKLPDMIIRLNNAVAALETKLDVAARERAVMEAKLDAVGKDLASAKKERAALESKSDAMGVKLNAAVKGLDKLESKLDSGTTITQTDLAPGRGVWFPGAKKKK